MISSKKDPRFSSDSSTCLEVKYLLSQSWLNNNFTVK